MIKLLFVIPSLRCGGAERSLVNLLNELSPQQYSIDLMLFRQKGEFLSLLPDYVHVIDTPDDMKRLYGPLSKAGKFAPVKLFGTLISRVLDGKASEGHMMFRWKHFYSKAIAPMPERYDTAIAYLEGESAYYICDFVNAARRVVWIHSDYSKLGQNPEEERPYFEKADAIVTVSEQCAEVMKQTFPKLKDKIFMLQNITSAAAVRKLAGDDVPEEYSKDTFTIASVGRLAEAKGFDIGIEAAAILKKRGAAFEWFIIGDGEMRESLRKQIEDSGLQEQVHLLGLRANPYPYMKSAQLLVQPSRFEGKSIVVDEAKILGTPVVITDYSTARDQIDHGRNGVIVKMNAEAVAEGIFELMNDPEQRKRIHENQLSEDNDNVSEVLKYQSLFDQ